MHTRAPVVRPGDRLARLRGAADHDAVRNRLLTAPWWALSLLTGTLYGLGMALSGRFLQGEDWTQAGVSGVLVGASFGAVMGPFAARMNRRFREAAGDLPPDRLRAAARLARRGAGPDDPELRRAAHRVALPQRDQLVRQRRWVLPVLALLTAFLLWEALPDGEPSAFSWLVVVLLLVLLAVHLLMARHLARRAELLADRPA